MTMFSLRDILMLHATDKSLELKNAEKFMQQSW
jgi:hypothetical protein